MGILLARAVATKLLMCSKVLVLLIDAATPGLSFPDGWRKSLYGSIKMTAVLPVVFGREAILIGIFRSEGRDEE